MSIRRISNLIVILLLNGCSSIPPDRGMDAVSELLSVRGSAALSDLDRHATGRGDLLDSLLGEELKLDTAVRIALINNPKLRLAYARLGIAEADIYDAARLTNPRLSLALLDSSASGAASLITLGLTQNFADLILLKSRKRLAAAEAKAVRYAVAAELFGLAQDVCHAYFRVLAAQQSADLRKLTANAVRLSASLAQRYFDSGNTSRLELSLAEAQLSEAELDLAMAKAESTAARITLNRYLGLTDAGSWRIQRGLPLPLEQEPDLPMLQKTALSQRLDLQAARARLALQINSLDTSSRWRYLGDLEAGIEYERETDYSRLLGPSFAIELPIFNQGQSKLLRARALVEQHQATLNELEIAIHNAVTLAYSQVMAARNRVEIYRSRFIPSRQDVVARTQELQNFMIVSPFDTLRAKNAEYDAYAGYIEALRDYWLAQVALAREIGTGLPAIAESNAWLDINSLNPSTMAPDAHGHSHSPTPQHPQGDHQ